MQPRPSSPKPRPGLLGPRPAVAPRPAHRFASCRVVCRSSYSGWRQAEVQDRPATADSYSTAAADGTNERFGASGSSWRDEPASYSVYEEPEVSDGYTSSDISDEEADGFERPFFSDSFKEALRTAMERQGAGALVDRPVPNFSTNGSGHAASGGAYPPVAVVGNGGDFERSDTSVLEQLASTPARELPSLSPMEELILTAIQNSRMSVRNLRIMEAQVSAALERELKQLERLEFSLEKARNDAAYYRTLEAIVEQQKRSIATSRS